MPKLTQRLVLGMLCALALLAAACQGLGGEPRIVATVAPAAEEAISPANRAAERITAGAQVWAYGCAECHGPLGEGTTDGAPLPDLTVMSEEHILDSISEGVGDEMPAFEDKLDFDELQAVMSYAEMIAVARARGDVNATAEAEVEETSGVITGQVANGTPGASLPADLPVTLYVLKSEYSEQTFETTANAGATYRFDAVPMSENYRYVVAASYGGVQFTSTMAQGVPDGATLELPVTVYEGGASAEDIRIVEIDLRVIVVEDTLQVAELVAFSNGSDRVYVTRGVDGATSVRLRLPENAQVEEHSGNEYVLSDDGQRIYDPQPLLPGDTRAMVALYSLPYDDSATFEQTFDYAVSAHVEVQLASDGLTITDEGWEAVDVDSKQEGLVAMFEGEFDQPAGATLRFEVTGAAGSAAMSVVPVPNLPFSYALIAVGVGTLALAAFMGVRDFRMSRDRRQRLSASDLLEQLVALDRDHDEGRLGQAEYERQRAAVKAQLSALMKEQQAQG